MNDGNAKRNVTLTVARDGETVYEQTFRSFPNITVLGQLDQLGNYTLTVSSFDCNSSTTTFDVSDPGSTVRTVSTEMACGSDEA